MAWQAEGWLWLLELVLVGPAFLWRPWATLLERGLRLGLLTQRLTPYRTPLEVFGQSSLERVRGAGELCRTTVPGQAGTLGSVLQRGGGADARLSFLFLVSPLASKR